MVNSIYGVHNKLKEDISLIGKTKKKKKQKKKKITMIEKFISY